MNIAYTITNIKDCGPFRIVNYLAHFEAEKGNCIFIVSLFGKDDQNIIKNLHPKIKVVSLNLQNKIDFLFRGSSLLRNVIRTYKIDIIHSHGILPDYLSSKQAAKSITTLHNNMQEDYILHFGRLLGILYIRWHKRILQHLDKIVFCSETAYDAMRSKTAKMLFIRNGTRLDQTSNEKRLTIRSRVRKKLHLHEDDLVLLCAAQTISRGKRVVELTRAFRLNEDMHYKLLVAGSDGEMGNCAKGRNIIMLGAVDDISDYLYASDIYVSNSSSEGFSMAALEALATGKTLLLSDIPSHREIIDLEKSKAYHGVTFSDVRNIIKEIQNLKLASPYSSTLLYGISSNRMCDEYDVVYNSMMEDK